MTMDRRDFLKLMGLGSAVLVLGPRGLAHAADMKAGKGDFLFVQCLNEIGILFRQRRPGGAEFIGRQLVIESV